MPLSVYMALFRARGSFGSSESFFFGCLRLHISSSGWWRERKRKWENHGMREITDSAAQKSSYTPWLQRRVGGHSCESAWPGWGSVDHTLTCTHGQKRLRRQKAQDGKILWLTTQERTIKWDENISALPAPCNTEDTKLRYINESYDSPMLILFLPNATNVKNRMSLYRLL